MKNISTPSKTSLNREPHYLKLSLMDSELSRMLSRLHSYRCAPCTSDMYEQFLELDDYGRLLKKTIDKTLNTVQNPVIFSKSIGDNEIVDVIKKYHIFQKNLSLYLKEAIVHH
ncbi:hypothetical protein [Aquimarina sp. 2201CG5-10]|uniref:hypothetical protein n=1 Tax=Aquimarina callyspongiae TaxID=3098150 RepID=UPI002AB3F3E4|nr:hypothetical protein [Aquimarina sp. 2201CG5-10]MDY8136316.1 hypothetical protein [Aquimarina sp. 2201CG5-10]